MDDSPHGRFAHTEMALYPGRFAPWTIRPLEVLYRLLRWQTRRSSIGHKRDVCQNGNSYTATIVGSLARLNIIVFRKGMFCEERCGDLTNFTPIPRNGESNPQIHSVLNAMVRNSATKNGCND